MEMHFNEGLAEGEKKRNLLSYTWKKTCEGLWSHVSWSLSCGGFFLVISEKNTCGGERVVLWVGHVVNG